MFRNFLILISIPITVFCTRAHSSDATQTDWSGGGGIPGPVMYWGDDFNADTDVEWFVYPSELVIQKHMAPAPVGIPVDTLFPGAVSVCSADIDGDWSMDILGASYSGGEIAWWENLDDLGTSWAKHQIDGDFTGAHCVHSADVDGDGFMDVLGASRIEDSIVWWENADGTGTVWNEHVIDGGFDNAISVYTADVNGDGHLDVLGAAEVADDIAWWQNVDGSGTSWIKHTVDGSFDNARTVFAADVNGDGHQDVLGAAELANDITWWENADGSGTSWTEHTVSGSFAGATSVYAADVNSDGYMDILGAGFYADEIAWWENLDGSGTSWTEHTVGSGFDGAYSVFSADLNKDGFADILGASQNSDDITWWENVDGSGTVWTEHTAEGSFDVACSVHSADVNGDGWSDLMGAAFGGGDIAWWNLTEYLPEGMLESSILDVQESPDWQMIYWNCSEPAGTGVNMQVRASDNSSSMGAWSDTLTAPCSLDGILEDEACFFQYRVLLDTESPLFSPVLHNVSVAWEPYSGAQQSSAGAIDSFALLGSQPNPVCGNAVIVFSVPVDSRVELTVFDLAGCTVGSTDDTYEAGVHGEAVEGLSSGVYLVRMVSAEFTTVGSFVVMD